MCWLRRPFLSFVVKSNRNRRGHEECEGKKADSESLCSSNDKNNAMEREQLATNEQ